QIFQKVLENLKEQEATHINLSARTTKSHHYDYKIGSLCFIKTPNIKFNLSPKLRPKFEGPYRVVERFSNVNYRVQHVERGRGSRVVWVSDRGLPCHEFEPSTTKDPPCRVAMHAKSVES
ncbi:hypothetical protein TNCV_1872071, partial [Trichonephila clavipes]